MATSLPKVARIALDSAFAPSTMNSRGTAGSSPRSTRLSKSAWTVAVFSVAPSTRARGCLPPSPSMPIAATSTRSSLTCSPSIWTTSRSSFDRSALMKAPSFSEDRATKRRDAADFDTPLPGSAGTSPSGRRTARPNRRVETLISIRSIAQRPSQSSDIARSQLGIGTSRPPTPRTRGRLTSTLPPWKPIRPRVLPQRCASRFSSRPWRGPQAASTSACIIAPSASIPAARQSRSKLC